MAVLPSGYPRNMGEVARYFKIINERLSELYSIHGKQLTRGGIKTVDGATDIGSNNARSVEGDGINPLKLDFSNKGIKFQTQEFGKDKVPAKNVIYRDQIAKALGHTISTGTLLGGHNLVLDSFDGTNAYTYSFKTPMKDAFYSVLVTPFGRPNVATNAPIVGVSIVDRTSFIVYTWLISDHDTDQIGQFQVAHSIAVFGNQ